MQYKKGPNKKVFQLRFFLYDNFKSIHTKLS